MGIWNDPKATKSVARKSPKMQSGRARKRSSHRPEGDSLGPEKAGVVGGSRVSDWVDTVSKESASVVLKKELKKTVVEEPAVRQMNGCDDVLNRAIVIEQAVKKMDGRLDGLERSVGQLVAIVQRMDKQNLEKQEKQEMQIQALVDQVKRRAEQDGGELAAQKQVIEQSKRAVERWQQEAGAAVKTMMTMLRQELAVANTKAEVETPSVPSVTVKTEENDIGNREDVQAAERVKPVKAVKAAFGAQKVVKKSREDLVSEAVVEGEAPKVETKRKDDNPLSFLGAVYLLLLTPCLIFVLQVIYLAASTATTLRQKFPQPGLEDEG
jgi:hypothetical protein